MNAVRNKLNFKTYFNVDQTLSEIKDMIHRHKNDDYLEEFDSYTLAECYNYISKQIPYVPDPENVPMNGGKTDVELIKSPYHTMYFGGDCDCKFVFLACMLERKKIPYRAEVTSYLPTKEFNHIYAEIFLQDVWIPFDATYDWNEPFVELPYTLKRIYDWNFGKTVSFEVTKNSIHSHGSFANRNMPGMYNTRTLSGGTGLGNNIMLATLDGCKPCERAMMLGQDGGAGAQPGGSFDITGIVGLVTTLFTSMFGHTSYVDAYHAWDKAVQNLDSAASANNTQAIAAAMATIAVLGVDYMNPPGANVCTDSAQQYCGNRAQWSVIQPAVMQKVSAVAPFMYYLLTHTSTPGYNAANNLSDIYNYYQNFKSHGAMYLAYSSAVGINPTTGLTAGMSSNTLIVIALIIAGIMMLREKSKK